MLNKMKRLGTIRVMFISALMVLIPMSRADAHKVMLYAYVEGEKVFAEGYFGDGKKIVNSNIEVFDSSGKKLLEGKTDREGLFVFTVPKKDDLLLVLNASMGHRATFKIPANKIDAQEPARKGKSGVINADKKTTSGVEEISAVEPGVALTAENVRAIVDESLDRKLKPIVGGMLKLQQKRPGITEILGGIGYIFGIFGVIMYFKARRNGSQ
ncbi:MAG: hypothetical protein JRC66_02810 [Deltaproteobacteria bacterium]|nr:hypothetical protein [Deltaproteobacteria bacterium]